jgi:hypothetical protein
MRPQRHNLRRGSDIDPSLRRRCRLFAATVHAVTDNVAAPRPFQRLSDRLAGRPVDELLFEDLPPHLEHSLQRWVGEVLDVHDGLARDVALRLRLPLQLGYRVDLLGVRGDQVLDVVDAILQLHPGLVAYASADYPHMPPAYHLVERWRDELHDLRQILEHGRSAYHAEARPNGIRSPPPGSDRELS